MAFPDEINDLAVSQANAPANLNSTAWAVQLFNYLSALTTAIKTLPAPVQEALGKAVATEIALADKADTDLGNLSLGAAIGNLLGGAPAQADMGKALVLSAAGANARIGLSDLSLEISNTLYTPISSYSFSISGALSASPSPACPPEPVPGTDNSQFDLGGVATRLMLDANSISNIFFVLGIDIINVSSETRTTDTGIGIVRYRCQRTVTFDARLKYRTLQT